MTHDDDNLDRLLDRWTVEPLGKDLTGPIMARARDEEAALDRLLGLAVSRSLDRDLAPEVMRTVRRRRHRRLVAAIGGALAAAAGLMLAVSAWLGPPSGPTGGVAGVVRPDSKIGPISADDRAIAKALAQDVLVLEYWDTIRAMEQQEQEQRQRADDLNS